MLVPVTYTGPRPVLELSWTTDGLRFEVGGTIPVPAALVPLLKELPGHGFTFGDTAPAESAGAVAVEPEPDPAPATPEPIPAEADEPPAKKPAGRKARG